MLLRSKIFAALVTCVAVALLASACGSSGNQATKTGLTSGGLPSGLPPVTSAQKAAWSKFDGTIYALTPGVTSARWTQFDVPLWTKALKQFAPNAKLKELDGPDATAQQSAMESALAANADGIIFVATIGATNTTALLKSAADANVPVVGYAHDISDAPYDRATNKGAPNYQDTVNLAKEYMVPGCELVAKDAMASTSDKPMRLAYMGLARTSPALARYDIACKKAVDAAVSAGKIKIVCEEHVDTFAAADHQKMMEQCLTKTDNGVDAVLSHNDDVVGGDIAALKEQKLQGKVPVYGGYDATLEGVQRVLAGWQKFDIVPPYAQQAYMAIELLLSHITKSAAPTGYPNFRYWNGDVLPLSDPGIPAAILDNFHVYNADDIQKDIVDTHIYTKKQICDPTGVAADTPYCKG